MFMLMENDLVGHNSYGKNNKLLLLGKKTCQIHLVVCRLPNLRFICEKPHFIMKYCPRKIKFSSTLVVPGLHYI